MTAHDRFQARTAELCRRAGIDLIEAIPLARATREDIEAIAAHETGQDCAFVHPHEGTPCQPREPGAYRGVDDWHESGRLIVR